MPKGQKKKGQKKSKKPEKIKKKGPFARSFRIGGAIQHKRDLTRFMRWPRYIMVQRQKKILMQRLKIPPAINQFTRSIPKNLAGNLFKLLKKYIPESRKEQKMKDLKTAKEKMEIETEKKEEEKSGKKPEKKEKVEKEKKPDKSQQHTIKYGLKHVTALVENKEAKIVAIAHDVDPIELVVWLPQLCIKQEIPFAIVKNKERLGALVKKKTASCVALTSIRPEDKQELDMLCGNFRAHNAERKEIEGGLVKGIKSRHRDEAVIKAKEVEAVKKSGL